MSEPVSKLANSASDAGEAAPMPRLPPEPGPAGELVAAKALAARGASRGLGARVRGFAAPALPGRDAGALAATGSVGMLLATVAPIAGWSVALAAGVVAAARWRGARWRVVPGRPAWSVLLAGPSRGTRRVLAGALDAVHAARRADLAVTVAVLASAPLPALLGPRGALAAAAVLAALALSLLGRRHRAPEDGGRAAARAERLIEAACAATPELAVLASTAGDADACGVLALLTWWGFTPGQVKVGWLGSEAGARALRTEGWDVELLEPGGGGQA